MNSEKTAIKILSITALLLAAAYLFIPAQSRAQEVSYVGDYIVASYPTTTGADALYITDTRLGKIMVVNWDNSRRIPVPMAVQSLENAFGGGK